MDTSAHDATTGATVAAGWYDDPAGTDQLRYWNGVGWTAHLHPRAAQAAAARVDAHLDHHVDQSRAEPAATTVRDGGQRESQREPSDDPDLTVEEVDDLDVTVEDRSVLGLTVADARNEDDLQDNGLDDHLGDRQGDRQGDLLSVPDQVIAVLGAHGWRTTTQVARQTDLTQSQVSDALRDLVDVGRVVAATAPGSPPRFALADDPRAAVVPHTSSALVPSAGASMAATAPPPQRYGTAPPPQRYGTGPPPQRDASGPVPAPIGFGDAIRMGLERAVQFEGRATRPEYWWFALFNALVLFGAGLLFVIVPVIGPILAVLAWLVVGVAALAVGVRRLHDVDRSGAWLFWLGLAPVGLQLLAIPAVFGDAFGAALVLMFFGNLIGGIGGIVLLVFMLLPGTPGPNRYGPPHHARR